MPPWNSSLALVLWAALGLPVCTAYGLEAISVGVDEIVGAYVNQIEPSRFKRPNVMEYRMTVSFPTPGTTPEHYVRWIDYTHRNKPPMHRVDGKLGPMYPSGTMNETHTHVWNGRSEVNSYQRPRNHNITIKRSGSATAVPFANEYLRLLGFPHVPSEQEEPPDQKVYLPGKDLWLPWMVTAEHGYAVDPQTEKVDNRDCVVVRRPGHDALWFELDDDGRLAKLLKRDLWLQDPYIYREVSQYFDYGDNRLPQKIVVDVYAPAKERGEATRVDRRLTYELKRLEFVSPGDAYFRIAAGPGASVLDLNTMLSLAVQKPGAPPFENVLGVPREPYPERRISPLAWALVWTGGVALVGLGLLLRRRLV